MTRSLRSKLTHKKWPSSAIGHWPWPCHPFFDLHTSNFPQKCLGTRTAICWAMGHADIALRHIANRHPGDLARAILPGAETIAVHGYLDSQLTHIERRLDKSFDISLAADRHALHVEFEVDPNATLPFRVFEYQALFTIAQTHHRPHEAPPPIESVVLVLRGPKKPWPPELCYTLSWPGRPFSGVRFRVEPVYQRTQRTQRTIAELRVRGSPFWLALTPLARDATPAMMHEVINEIRSSIQDPNHRADLFAAMLVMADLDPWKKKLRKEQGDRGHAAERERRLGIHAGRK